MSQVRRGIAAVDVFLIVIAIACGVLIVGLTRYSGAKQKPESIEIKFVEQAQIVLAGQKQTVQLLLSNEHQNAAFDIRLSKACTCSGVEVTVPPGLVLHPGESVELNASVHPSLDQASITLDYVIHAMVNGEQHNRKQTIHIPIASPFEGWPEIVNGSIIPDAVGRVFRIGPVNPMYFSGRADESASHATCLWEIRNRDLAVVPSTLVTDQSGLWIEIPEQTVINQLDGLMLMLATQKDGVSKHKVFIPVIVKPTKET